MNTRRRTIQKGRHSYQEAMKSPFTFDNRFVQTLPADPVMTNQPRQVPGACYSWVTPTPVSDPKLLAWSREMAELLELPREYVVSEEFLSVFSGNLVLDGMTPFAMNYAGHQFGNWAGQLGDGRAINLAEVIGRGGQRWTLQLKGAGPTPYSRTADGRAVLRSSIREFLCSEAMHHLGVPTTRALSLIATGDSVVRDMFYDGRPIHEPGAVVCRVAPSFLRFGNFQVHASREEHGILRNMINYSIETDFPHLGKPSDETYVKWFEEICHRTADLMVHWMRVGFVHGVMNTDNMSILGLTIDYGPYGWIDGYDPDWTPNTTDAHSRRYVFGNQPAVAHWNLGQLARAILPVTGQVGALQDILNEFPERYHQGFDAMMAAKLGLSSFQEDSDRSLIDDLQVLLASAETDMTLFFRLLAGLNPSDSPQVWLEAIGRAWYSPPSEEISAKMEAWLLLWSARSMEESNHAGDADARFVSRSTLMNATNPKYVLRNYMAQMAIDKAHEGDYSLIAELLEVMRRPYDEQPEFEHYFAKRPEWARDKPGSSMLSCSS
jgi:uncharacterized protein YdiU (UPF0061 family)